MKQQHELQLELPINQAASHTTSAENSADAAAGAQYSLALDETPMPFRLRRSQRSNVSFAVDERGLQVSAPRGMSLPQIQQAIRDGSRAIVGKQTTKSAGLGKLALPKNWHDGVRFPFLGHEISLRLNTESESAELCGDLLHLPLPPEATERQIKDSVQSWLQAEAKRLLEQQISLCAQQLGITAPQWVLSFAAGSWGGMESDGRLRLSWRLIHLTPEEIGRILLRQLAPLQKRAPTSELWDHA